MSVSPCGYEIRQVDRKVGERPVDRAGAGAGAVGRDRRGERRFKERERRRWRSYRIRRAPRSSACVETVWVSVEIDIVE